MQPPKTKAELLAEEMRAIQGQSPPMEVAGKQYIFTKLKRRDCQETLYDLVQPLIDIISTVIESADLNITDLKDMDRVADAIMNNIGLVAKIFKTISYDQIHRLAKKVLKDVIIDKTVAPDDFENPDSEEPGYYDDKQLELLQALIKGVQVNYPFLGNLIKKKEGTKHGSDQSKEKKTKTK